MNAPNIPPPSDHDADVQKRVIELCRATGYQLYKARKYEQAEVVARGLVASDEHDWYHHSLLSATLQKLGRFSEALAQVDQGLHLLPDHPRLQALRQAITASALRSAHRLIDQNAAAQGT